MKVSGLLPTLELPEEMLVGLKTSIKIIQLEEHREKRIRKNEQGLSDLSNRSKVYDLAKVSKRLGDI